MKERKRTGWKMAFTAVAAVFGMTLFLGTTAKAEEPAPAETTPVEATPAVTAPVVATPVPNGPTAENDYKQGKVYKITPKSKPLKASKFAKSSLYNKKTRPYFTIRSYMEKFQKAGKGTLILKKGTYSITNTIQVPSNVTIIFEKGVKLVKGTKTNKKDMPAAITMFQLIRPSKAKKKGVYSGHNGEKNIHFVGKGNVTLDLKYMNKGIGIVMGHNQDITVDRINFKNMNGGHFIEMDASRNVNVTNCSFKNIKKKSDYVKEAINLDTPDRTTEGFHNDWSKYDKTPNENVTIANCRFSNLGRAIGTHKYSARGSQQIYHTNMVIRNNVITNMKWDAPVRVINWKDSVLENNTVTTVKQPGKSDTRGFLVSGAVNVSIRNNIFTNMGRPIQCIAWKNSGPGSQYPITYNALTDENLADLATNVGKQMKTGEYYVRINAKYNVFTNAQMVDIKRG